MEDIKTLKEKIAQLEKENKALKKDLEFHKTIVNDSDVFLHIDEIYEGNYFKIIWSNDQVKQRVGPILESMNKGVKQYHNSSNSKEDIAAMENVITAIKSGELSSFSAVHNVRSDEIGSRWIYTSMTPYERDENGIPYKFLCASVDLTEKLHDLERYSVMQREFLRNQNKDIIDSLTKTELDIIRTLVMGKSEKEIAEFQTRSLHTIKTHTKNIRQKLNIKKNTEIVKFAVSVGIA